MAFNGNIGNVMRSEVIIMGWEGVLQLIEEEMTQTYLELYEDYYSFLDHKKLTEESDFLHLTARTTYSLESWFKRSDIELDEKMRAISGRPYTHLLNLFQNSKFLTMFDTLIALTKNDNCSKIMIMTNTPFPGGDPRKTFIFENLIKPLSDKIELIQIPQEVSKADYINEHQIYFTVVVEDEETVLREIIEKCPSSNKEFWVPIMGYNRDFRNDRDLLFKLYIKNSTVSQYQQQQLDYGPEDLFEDEL